MGLDTVQLSRLTTEKLREKWGSFYELYSQIIALKEKNSSNNYILGRMNCSDAKDFGILLSVDDINRVVKEHYQVLAQVYFSLKKKERAFA